MSEQTASVPSHEVLLPYYGDPGLMREAVESLLSQSSVEWYLTVLDDAYPDRQIERWLSELDDERIQFRKMATNQGVNASFQHLLQQSTADYVTFMGCDDRMLPSYIEHVHHLIARFPQATVIQPGVQVIDSGGSPTRPLVDRVKSALRSQFPSGPAVVAGEKLAASLLLGNWTYFPSLTWRRDRIADRGFREGLEVVLDLDLLFDVVAKGGQMVVDSEVVFQYRRHRASVSSLRASDRRRFVEERVFFEEAARRTTQQGWPLATLSAKLHLTSRLHAVTHSAWPRNVGIDVV